MVVLYSDSVRIGSGRAGPGRVGCGCAASPRLASAILPANQQRQPHPSERRREGARGRHAILSLRDRGALPSAWLLLSFRLSHPSKVRRGSFPCAEFLVRWSFTRFAVYPVSSSWDFSLPRQLIWDSLAFGVGSCEI